jgi:osmotically-inducible protein OsmY
MFNKPILTVAFATALAATLLTTSGCAVTRNQETVGAYVDDAALTTRVKAKFAADPTVSAMAISVETLKGTVQLSGFAKSYEEKSMAEKLARETSGVVAVRNDIAIRQGS